MTASAPPAPHVAVTNGSSTPVPDLRRAQPVPAPGKFSATLAAVAASTQHAFGCDGVGVILIADGTSYAASAASTAEAARADGLQIEHHEGPGLDAITGQWPLVVPDLRFDGRWRFWAPQAASLGFQSTLSLALTEDGPLGSLNLYSRQPSFFGPELLARGHAFAQQVSIAIAVAVEREQLMRACESREIVGQATGIVMERFGITAERAVAALRRYSSDSNQKLRTIAQRLVTDGTLPPELVVRLTAATHQA